jgi:hypothetical protein
VAALLPATDVEAVEAESPVAESKELGDGFVYMVKVDGA